jgi:hypothetical protein
MDIKVWHGTSTRHRADIRAHGLVDPYVTDRPDRARYYAAEEAEAGGEPLVLEFAVAPAALRYDRPAMEEPVMAAESRRDAAWTRAERAHPEWVHGESLSIPPEAWEVSWKGVGSARVAGTIPAERLRGL